MITALLCRPFMPSIAQGSSVMSENVLLSARSICTTSPLAVNCAGKYRKTSDRSLRLTYQMARRPTHIGVSKGCMTFHSQNLEGFRQQQPVTIAQDEVVVRLMRGMFYKHLTAQGTEFVIKRRAMHFTWLDFFNMAGG
uniref:Uncharacterized protein n=1 Tax=Ditylenchus dipsaci TaxID=166011 RepID=A0A915D3X3_9BILA